MGLTKRQAQAVNQIINEEVNGAYVSQQERHRILAEVDAAESGKATAKAPIRGLDNAVVVAIDDLMEVFAGKNTLYEGVEFDNGQALKRASSFLRQLIEADVKEVQDMLASGEFGDEGI
jgi:hypothetical protein